MLLEEEQHIIQWLSQYGALPKMQVAKLIKKSDRVAKRIINYLLKTRQISLINNYYIGLDPLQKPDDRMVDALWVLLQFINNIALSAHYVAEAPAQLYFLKENKGYEVIVLREGDEELLKLKRIQEGVKYIIVVPDVSWISKVSKLNVPCVYATITKVEKQEPMVTFYSED